MSCPDCGKPTRALFENFSDDTGYIIDYGPCVDCLEEHNVMTTTKPELTKRDYQNAIDVQYACNLCGVVQSFAKVMCKILHDTGSTDAANKHPIAILYADKIASLTGTQGAAFDAFQAAYGACVSKGGYDD